MRFLIAVGLFGALACTQGISPPSQAADPGVNAILTGWMGQFVRREPALAEVLKSSPGWGQLRDMSLFEAVQSFEAGRRYTDRIGAARSYLALADLCSSLDQLLIEVETAYLDSPSGVPTSAQRARRVVANLRAGALDSVRAELDTAAPEGFAFTWQIVGKVLKHPKAKAGAPLSPGGERERRLGAAIAYLWDLPPVSPGESPYDHAVEAMRAGDFAGGVLSLQLLEFSAGGEGPGPELFLYALLRRCFAELAVAALGDTADAGGRYLLAVARDHLGQEEAARALFREAAVVEDDGSPAGLLFSPLTDASERRALARVRGGESPAAAGSPLLALTAARTETEVTQALAEVTRIPASFPEDGTQISELYAARRAEAARLGARVLWRVDAGRQAVDVLERAHRKSAGYRPDFINPPAFLVDLARARQRVGEYAPAVAVLFKLAAEHPSARVAYESLKRLYASRTGGEMPPR